MHDDFFVSYHYFSTFGRQLKTADLGSIAPFLIFIIIFGLGLRTLTSQALFRFKKNIK